MDVLSARWIAVLHAVLFVSVAASLAAAAPADQSPAAPAAPALQKIQLQYKFQPGEVVRWKVVHRATVASTIQGSSQQAQMRTTSTKVWRVAEAGGGKATLLHQVDDVDMWQQTQGRQAVTYNSRTDTSPPPGYEDVAKSIGKPLTRITIDAQGKMLDRQELFPQTQNDPDQVTPLMPRDAVAVGDTWQLPRELEVRLKDGGKKKIAARQQYTLKKVVDGIAEIEMETQVLAPLNDPELEAQLLQRITKGTFRFDVAAGRLVSQQLDLDRRVIGFSGAASSLHCVMRLTEEILPATPATPTTPAAASKPTKTQRRK